MTLHPRKGTGETLLQTSPTTGVSASASVPSRGGSVITALGPAVVIMHWEDHEALVLAAVQRGYDAAIRDTHHHYGRAFNREVFHGRSRKVDLGWVAVVLAVCWVALDLVS